MIVSYNINGVNHPIKRKKIMNQLKRLNCSIALLQETHLNDIEHKKLRREWVGQVFSASCEGVKKEEWQFCVIDHSVLLQRTCTKTKKATFW